MRLFIASVIIALLSFGCKSYVQVFKTNTTNTKIEKDEDGFFVFENDSLKITYSFWEQKGLLAFSIYNKLNQPLYVDWKKTSYIDNSVKLDYWIDEEKTKTLSAYKSYFYNGPLLIPGSAISNTVGASISSTVKAERITFIPPSSNYYRSQFYILPIPYFKLDGKIVLKEVPRNDKPKKKTTVYEKYYSKKNSPAIFRNFLTFSFSEDFKKEFYVDNEFYISEITQMDIRHFEQIKRSDRHKFGNDFLRDEDGQVLKFSVFKNGSSFYIKIPNYWSP